jgi:RNA-directed DNA polymerase
MAFWDWLRRLFGWSPATTATVPTAASGKPLPDQRRTVTRLSKTRRTAADRYLRRIPVTEVHGEPPYRLARFGSQTGRYLDLTLDHDEGALRERCLPVVRTPEEIAGWLGLKLPRLAWLVHHFSSGRAESPQKSHYAYHWVAKPKGGWRLIEAPKKTLKQVQRKILKEILEKVPPHDAAHGFLAGRSIVTNAKPHVGQHVVLKWDLRNFYPSVGFSRVVAILRSLGYGREAAIWLARLMTTALPANAPFPPTEPSAMLPYLRRHLPQGAPTSPALANLSAFRLDVRLHGLARSFGARYTRYADDLTFSGDERFARSLKVFIPLVRQICREERFQLHPRKRRILRAHQRQAVAGVVVNTKTNVSRKDYDQLKAILVNCVRFGPSTQNRERHPNFSAQLQGRIAHVMQLNRRRGEQLSALYRRIDWKK